MSDPTGIVGEMREMRELREPLPRPRRSDEHEAADCEAADCLLSLSPRMAGVSPKAVSPRLAGECVSLLATPDLVDLCPGSYGRFGRDLPNSRLGSQQQSALLAMWGDNKRLKRR